LKVKVHHQRDDKATNTNPRRIHRPARPFGRCNSRTAAAGAWIWAPSSQCFVGDRQESPEPGSPNVVRVPRFERFSVAPCPPMKWKPRFCSRSDTSREKCEPAAEAEAHIRAPSKGAADFDHGHVPKAKRPRQRALANAPCAKPLGANNAPRHAPTPCTLVLRIIFQPVAVPSLM
jgi:hypothetical protein